MYIVDGPECATETDGEEIVWKNVRSGNMHYKKCGIELGKTVKWVLSYTFKEMCDLSLSNLKQRFML